VGRSNEKKKRWDCGEGGIAPRLTTGRTVLPPSGLQSRPSKNEKKNNSFGPSSRTGHLLGLSDGSASEQLGDRALVDGAGKTVGLRNRKTHELHAKHGGCGAWG